MEELSAADDGAIPRCYECTDEGPAGPALQAIRTMTHEDLIDCIEACNHCANACTHCGSECLRGEDAPKMKRCIELSRDCAVICRMVVTLMCADSRFSLESCRLCIESCRMCEEECRRHAPEHCQKCADACERCIEECERASRRAERHLVPA